jgi:hypothetical protein
MTACSASSPVDNLFVFDFVSGFVAKCSRNDHLEVAGLSIPVHLPFIRCGEEVACCHADHI